MNKIENVLFQQDDLRNAEYVGEIVDASDPKNFGRCKIKVYGKFDDLNSDNLPWAYPAQSPVFSSINNGGAGSFSTPKVGTMVKVTFFNGDIYSPMFSCIMNPNLAMISEISSSYTNAHVLCYDEDEKLKVYYTQNKGLHAEVNGSHVTINPDQSVTIRNDNVGNQVQVEADGRINISNTDDSLKLLLKDTLSAIINMDITTPDGPGFVAENSMQAFLQLQIRLLKLLS